MERSGAPLPRCGVGTPERGHLGERARPSNPGPAGRGRAGPGRHEYRTRGCGARGAADGWLRRRDLGDASRGGVPVAGFARHPRRGPGRPVSAWRAGGCIPSHRAAHRQRRAKGGGRLMTQQPIEAGAVDSTVTRDARLGADGVASGDAPMSREQVLEAYRLMLQSQAIDDLAIKLQRLKRVGLYAPVQGQEAAVVGSALALDPRRDWLVPASREQPAMIRHGLPLVNFFAGYMGRLDSAGIPEGVKLLPRQQAIAAQLPHAAGLAWAMKLRKERAAVMVYCGDGASSEGDFHESLNLAGVMHVPLVVVVINN